jgi:hypothetical protein
VAHIAVRHVLAQQGFSPFVSQHIPRHTADCITSGAAEYDCPICVG